MFGKKKTVGTTVLILDIESGSVAVALVHVPGTGMPKVIAYKREQVPLLSTRSSSTIAISLEKALMHSLSYIAEVAARMRLYAGTEPFGTVKSAVVFFAAPWGTPNLATRKAAFVPGMREFTASEIRSIFGDIAVSFYTSADALVYGNGRIGRSADTLIASMRGELLELLLVNNGGPEAYSTVPLGTRSILRTLKTHGQLNEHEAHSMLVLAHAADDMAYEPLAAAGHHLSETFAEGAALLVPAGAATNIVVVGEHPLGEWFARNLAQNKRVTDLFAEESTVEALRAHHMGVLLEPTPVQDPFILLESLFVEHVGVVY